MLLLFSGLLVRSVLGLLEYYSLLVGFSLFILCSVVFKFTRLVCLCCLRVYIMRLIKSLGLSFGEVRRIVGEVPRWCGQRCVSHLKRVGLLSEMGLLGILLVR